jgi:Arc/MetJ family transcription regulator
MRTNVVLNEELLKQAKKLTGIKTTRQVIHEALETLVRLREQGSVRALRGQLGWKGDLDTLRQGRDLDHS